VFAANHQSHLDVPVILWALPGRWRARVAPAMAKPPFSGALGQRIFENVSEQGWKLWEGQATILMNHHGLSMADPEARKFLLKQMEDFFFGEGAALPPGYVPQQTK